MCGLIFLRAVVSSKRFRCIQERYMIKRSKHDDIQHKPVLQSLCKKNKPESEFDCLKANCYCKMNCMLIM